METQIIEDRRQKRQKRVILPDKQHGTDQFHYTSYTIAAGAQMNFMAHWHPEYEIMLPLDGYLDFLVEGRLYHLQPGEALLVNSGVVHGHAELSDGYGKYICFSFGEGFLFPDPNSFLYQRFFSPLRTGSRSFTKHLTGTKPYEKEVLAEIERLYRLNSRPAENALAIQICLLTIFERLYRSDAFEPCTETSAQKESVKSALWYINHHFTSPLSIEEISRFLSLSTDHFSRLFKMAVGSSPKDYILDLRIRHAIAEMEAKPGGKLWEIAVNSGFSDPNYFSRVFKSKLGISPSAYQKSRKAAL